MRKKQKLLLHNTARKPLLRFRAVSDFRQQSPCPVVLSEIEPKADAILVSFNVQHQALLDIISGKNEPSA